MPAKGADRVQEQKRQRQWQRRQCQRLRLVQQSTLLFLLCSLSLSFTESFSGTRVPLRVPLDPPHPSSSYPSLGRIQQHQHQHAQQHYLHKLAAVQQEQAAATAIAIATDSNENANTDAHADPHTIADADVPTILAATSADISKKASASTSAASTDFVHVIPQKKSPRRNHNDDNDHRRMDLDASSSSSSFDDQSDTNKKKQAATPDHASQHTHTHEQGYEQVPSSDAANGGNDDDNGNNDDKNNKNIDSGEAIKRLARKRLLMTKSTTTTRQTAAPKETSVGARRVGSASVARSMTGSSKTTQLYTAIQRSAAAAASSNSNNNSTRVSQSLLQSTVETMMLEEQRGQLGQRTAATAHPIRQQIGPMGVLGEPVAMKGSKSDQQNHQIHALLQNPPPGTVLIPAAAASNTVVNDEDDEEEGCSVSTIAKESLSVRVASDKDDNDICNLRLSVFSDFSAELRKQFCARSIQVLHNRRVRGATCLVATTPVPLHGGTMEEMVVGSAEISVHEFHNTMLGSRRNEHSVLYVTEVAVNALYRRCGVGTILMEAVDKLASTYRTSVESLYLHVDVTNEAALRMYRNCGYVRVDQTDDMYREFTTVLNLHDGATRGRNHYLLCKHLRTPTWLNDVCGSNNDSLLMMVDDHPPEKKENDATKMMMRYDSQLQSSSLPSKTTTSSKCSMIGFDIPVQ